MSENEGADAEAADTNGAGDGPVAEESGADADETATDGAPEQDAAEVGDELLDRVAEADPEEVAREIAALQVRADEAEAALAEREAEVEDLESRLKRKQADFQNYKKRMEKRREQEKRRATEDLVERLLDVRDNLVRALEQDEDADVRGGVETTLTQFDEVLDAENVEVVDPEPGDEVDPQRHEVLMRVESDQAPGTVDEVYRPGYEMADKVLRAAQVTVAEDDE